MWRENVSDKKLFLSEIEGKLNYLISARPTAVNMKKESQGLMELGTELCNDPECTPPDMKRRFIQQIVSMLEKDIADNKAIGRYGTEAIVAGCPALKTVNLLTHCNTGSLATAGYGTALGVVRSMQEAGRLNTIFLTETRPYNQGSRLTAFEMVHEKFNATLICDSSVAYLFQKKHVQAVVVGADRVALNGDTANKIGTYQIACLAKHHGVAFYVCAPFSSIDATVTSGDQIVIEERPEREMTYLNGSRIAAPGIAVWNPAFDITPAALIKGIITERGVFEPKDLKSCFE
jgi:methylthioribose-1-phosphate isomerase